MRGIKNLVAMLMSVIMSFNAVDLTAAISYNPDNEQSSVVTEVEGNNTEIKEKSYGTDEYEIVNPSYDVIDLGPTLTSGNGMAMFSGESVVSIKSGEYEKWIDRIAFPSDNTEAMAYEVYNTLVEASDNDGSEDYLIDDVHYATGKFYLCTISYPEEPSEDEINADAMMLRAVYDAFDRDHPEVFWLSGDTSLSITGGLENGAYVINYYMMTLGEDSYGEPYDMRITEYDSESKIIAGIALRDSKVAEILAAVVGMDDADKIEYFNDHLVKHNEYNTTVAFVEDESEPKDAYECISALDGRVGAAGPVCEAYARAFMLLCKRSDIPCVLVDGANHMWNYVKVGGNWYAMDVTWNDPAAEGAEAPVSRYETKKWSLVGSETLCDGSSAFKDGHPVENQASVNGLCFTNGPTISATAYVEAPIDSINVDVTELTYGYDSTATVTVTLDNSFPDAPCTYQWYKVDGENETVVEDATGVTLPLGLDAGTYFCRVTCEATNVDSDDVVVVKKTVIPSLSGTYEKEYDGGTEVDLEGELTIVLSGVLDGDDVEVDATNYAFAAADVGTTELLVAGLILTGEDAVNYVLSTTDLSGDYEGQVSIVPKDISGATVTLVNGGVFTFNNANHTQEVASVNIDGLSVTYEVTGNVASAIGTHTLTITGTGNFTGTVEKTFTISGLEFDESAILYNNSTSMSNWYNEDVVISAEGYTVSTAVDGTYTSSHTVTNEGNNSVTLYFKNVDGYITDAIEITDIKIDKTAPVFTGDTDGINIETNNWKNFLNTITFGLLFKETKTVTISATDDGSGLDKTYYYLDNSGSTTPMTSAELDAINFTEGNSFNLTADSKYVIYAYAVDGAGNRSAYICSEGIVVDTQAPTVNVVAPLETAGTLRDTTATIKLEMSDAGTGVTTYELVDIAGIGNDEYTPSYTVTESSQGVFVITGLSPNTTYEFGYVVADGAGNETKNSDDYLSNTISFTTLKTLPEFDAVPTITGTYGQQVKDMTIHGVDSANGVPGTWSISESETDVPTVGTTDSYVVIFTPDSEDYGVYRTNVVPTISKKSIVVTVDDAERQYKGDNPTFSATVENDGLVAGDTVADLNLNFTTTADVTSEVGEYPITATYTSANYDVTVENGTLTVTVVDAPSVDGVSKKYVFSAGSNATAETIDVARLLPNDRGTTTYAVTKTDASSIVYDEAVDTNGTLTYKVLSGELNTTATITVTATSKNYAPITVTITVVLTDKLPIKIKDGYTVAVAGNASLTYGQTLSELNFNNPSFVVEGQENVIVEGTLVWAQPTKVSNAGTNVETWIFVPTESDVYAELEGSVNVVVNKATPTVVSPTTNSVTYNPSAPLSEVAINGGSASHNVGGTTTDVAGTWTWVNGTTIPTISNSGYQVLFTPTDATNYNTVTKTIDLTVTKATPYVSVKPTASAISVGQTLGNSTLTGGTVVYSNDNSVTGYDTVVTGTFSWQNAAVKPAVSDSGVTEYTVVFKGGANYNDVTTTIKITVNKAGTPPSAPATTMTVDYDCDKLSEVTLPQNWQWVDVDLDNDLDVDLEVSTPVSVVAEYVGADAGNYQNLEVTIQVTRQDGPYVDGDEGSRGWEAIISAIEAVEEGAIVEINMNHTTRVSGEALEALRDNGVTAVIPLANDMSWTIAGGDIDAGALATIDMNAEFVNTSPIPTALVKSVTPSGNYKFLSLTHDGEFGCKPVLSMNLGTSNAGKLAKLYYYNEASGKMEFMEDCEIATDGTVQYTFEHASEYVISIEDEATDDATKAPNSGENMLVSLVKVSSVVVSGLGLVVLYVLTKKSKK